MKKYLLFIWYSGWNISLPFDFASPRCGQLLQCSTLSYSFGAELLNRVSADRESSTCLLLSLPSYCQDNGYPFNFLFDPASHDGAQVLSSISSTASAPSIHWPRLFALQLADFWNSEQVFLFHRRALLASCQNREVEGQLDHQQAHGAANHHDPQSPWALHSTHRRPLNGQDPNFKVRLQPFRGLATHFMVLSVAITPSHDSSSSASILERFCTWNSIVFAGARLVCGTQLREIMPSHH